MLDFERFFQRYAAAAEAMDVDELASLHFTPCIKVHGDGTVECLLTPEAVSGFFRRLAEKYEQRDHGASRFLDLEATPLGTDAAQASLTWE